MKNSLNSVSMCLNVVDTRRRFPAGTPQVGQGMEFNCLSVSSLIFIETRYEETGLVICAKVNTVIVRRVSLAGTICPGHCP